jgi:hypothetical protein
VFAASRVIATEVSACTNVLGLIARTVWAWKINDFLYTHKTTSFRLDYNTGGRGGARRWATVSQFAIVAHRENQNRRTT